MLFGEPDQGDPTAGGVAMNIGFHRLQAQWHRDAPRPSRTSFVLSVGYNLIRFEMGEFFDVTYDLPIQLRDEFVWRSPRASCRSR